MRIKWNENEKNNWAKNECEYKTDKFGNGKGRNDEGRTKQRWGRLIDQSIQGRNNGLID